MADYPYLRKLGGTPPFGYENDPDDDQLWKPIPEQLEALELGLRYIRSGKSSFRDVSQWLEEVTGRPLAISKLHKYARTRRRNRFPENQ